MKTKRQNHHRGWKQALSVLLVFALVAGVLLGVPALGGIAYAAPVLQDDDAAEPTPDTEPGQSRVDVGESCAVTVDFTKTMTGEPVTDLPKEQTVADLYLIAPAVRVPGYNVYAYCIDDTMPYYDAVVNFIDPIENWHKEPLKQAPEGYPENQGVGANNFMLFYYAPKDPDKAPVGEQEGLAELLAGLFFTPQPAEDAAQDAAGSQGLVAAGKVTPVKSPHIGKKATGLSAGLYLDVVHGEGLAPGDYAVLAKMTAKTANGEKEIVEKVCTVAWSSTKVYTFQPQLLSLPGLGVDAEGNLQTDTTLETWVYDFTVTAKGQVSERMAELQLEKSLAGGIVNGTAPVFVFRVTAYAPGVQIGGTPVYETVVTLRYDPNDPVNSLRSKVIDKIPVGSTVVIAEEYSGAGYKFSEAQVSTRPSGSPDAAGTAYDAVERMENGIIIRDIPAGRIHMTAPAGDAAELGEGSTETVTIVNTPTTTTNGGGSVINSFTLDSANGWTWTKRTYNAQTGQWEVGGNDAGTQTEEG